ncbi:type II toxin-antitoxin system RelE/ParE family toxin [Thalassospira sp.]|uniref:type II toxin-antitoxin system RelE/ParE family toxin n=1 Tax=Thalassospira sp. TaxID=1912094 RepID=UPI0027331F8D|nr:type II toxin-antitoxin system RelE/ParE family toxin [Thalassospira sp.]MDP2698451.1 type II toxin-antitoxin system RelE/ParE family toxin [Thalassospira sp.]
MIGMFRDKWLETFFVRNITDRKIPADIADRLFRKLQMVDDATCDRDLRIPPSNHFEALKGRLAGYHSIRINRQWRLIFRWDDKNNEATDIYLDNHAYR